MTIRISSKDPVVFPTNRGRFDPLDKFGNGRATLLSDRCEAGMVDCLFILGYSRGDTNEKLL